MNHEDLEERISSPRFATYVNECGGDTERAVELYLWTGQMAGALLVDFRHLEVFLRNHVHNAFVEHTNYLGLGGAWYEDDRWVKDSRHWWSVPATEQIEKAVKKVGRRGSADDVIAELSFGFWRYIFAPRHEQSFWTPVLDSAFVGIPGNTPRERRAMIDVEVGLLNQLRNRLAHHQPIFRPQIKILPNSVRKEFTLERQHNGLLHVVRWIDPKLPTFVLAKSQVKHLLTKRP